MSQLHLKIMKILILENILYAVYMLINISYL